MVHILLTVGTLFALTIFVPRNKIREAFLAFLICQLFSWPMSIAVSLLDLKEYPFRLFPRATEGSFILDYLVIPSVFTLFQVNYPDRKNRRIQFFHYTATTVVSLCFVPRQKALQAHFVFLFGGLPTWVLGLSVVQLNWIEYPSREFDTVNRTSFLFEYFVLPVICVLFNAFFPSGKPVWFRLGTILYSVRCPQPLSLF